PHGDLSRVVEIQLVGRRGRTCGRDIWNGSCHTVYPDRTEGFDTHVSKCIPGKGIAISTSLCTTDIGGEIRIGTDADEHAVTASIGSEVKLTARGPVKLHSVASEDEVGVEIGLDAVELAGQRVGWPQAVKDRTESGRGDKERIEIAGRVCRLDAVLELFTPEEAVGIRTEVGADNHTGILLESEPIARVALNEVVVEDEFILGQHLIRHPGEDRFKCVVRTVDAFQVNIHTVTP